MRLIVGADHGGWQLKETLVAALRAAGHEVEDVGTDSDESVDYPDYAGIVAHAVAREQVDRGLLICGSGQGMAMAAGKVAGVRAGCVSDPVSARLIIQHNNARILCLGARILGEELALGCLWAWLNAEFEGGRHARRVAKIEALTGEDG